MANGRWWDRGSRWAPYVPVAKRRATAAAHAKKLEKKRGRPLAPIRIEGRKIAQSFWGEAWCDNLESYSDYANRLPRGRTYARNGSVIDLDIVQGKITALVSGSEIYTLTITIGTLPAKTWEAMQRDCANSIPSLIDLLQGRFDRGVMERLTQKQGGLFPKPSEITMACSCPDSAGMCKHIAAAMYGVGARLDESPELLFTLRNVDHLELISQAVAEGNLDRALSGHEADRLETDDLGRMFGIELDTAAPSSSADNAASIDLPAGDRVATRPGGKARRARGQGRVGGSGTEPEAPSTAKGGRPAAKKKPAARPASRKRAGAVAVSAKARTKSTKPKPPAESAVRTKPATKAR